MVIHLSKTYYIGEMCAKCVLFIKENEKILRNIKINNRFVILLYIEKKHVTVKISSLAVCGKRKPGN